MRMKSCMIGLEMSDELRLIKELYSCDEICDAINAYAEIADISVVEGEKYCKCVFADCMYDSKKTMSEFENYLIGIANRKG